MSEWVFLNDGTPERSLNNDVAECLGQSGLLYSYSAHKGRVVKFTGFLYVNGGWIVVFPKTFNIPDDFEKKLSASALLYKVLVKYSRTDFNNSSQAPEFSSGQSDDRNKIVALSMYDFLLEDWGRFGPYRNVRKRNVRSQSGKIDWRRTISKVEPLVGGDGAPVYDNFITTRNDYSTLEQISLLQKWAVATADMMLGWLLSSGHGDMLLYPELKKYVGPCPVERRMAIRIIKAELQVQYDIRKIHVLRTILALVDGAPLAERYSSSVQLGVSSFWPIWESVCKFLLSDESSLHSKYLPYPVYLRQDGSKFQSRDAFSQRPDIVSKMDEQLLVVDAKYYDVRQNLPGWGDVVKQLFYEKSFKAIDYSDDIKNYFLFPSPSSDDAPAKVNVRSSYTNGLPNEMSIDEFAEITCRYYNIHDACSRYVSNCPDEEFKNSLFA